MTDDSRIMEMMEEMEAYFKERDSLFQDREDAYRERYEALVGRESDLKEKEEALEKSIKDHTAKLAALNEKEQEIRLKDEELKSRAGRQEEEYSRLKKKLQEDRLKLNLLETRLQNESLKQDAGRLKYGADMAERAKGSMPVLPCCVEAEFYKDPQYKALKEENDNLQRQAMELYDQVLSGLESRRVVEEEKQELFRLLLEADPEAAHLFEKAEMKDPGEPAGQEDPGKDREEPPDGPGGERKDR